MTDFNDKRFKKLAGLLKEEAINEDWGPKQQAKLLDKMIRRLEQTKEDLEDVFDDERQWRVIEKKIDRIIDDLVKKHSELEPDPYKHFMKIV